MCERVLPMNYGDDVRDDCFEMKRAHEHALVGSESMSGGGEPVFPEDRSLQYYLARWQA